MLRNSLPPLRVVRYNEAMKIIIEEINEGTRTVWFFHGTHPLGMDFCGTANDMETALDMARESAISEWGTEVGA